MSRNIDFNSTWQRLSDTVERVLLSLPVGRAAWTERFSDVYSICIGLPETLNEDLYKATQKFLVRHVDKLLVDEVRPAGPDLISVYARCWQIYWQGAKYLDFLYHHFNQQYVRKMRRSDADVEYGYYIDNQKEFLEIGELAMETWKEVLIEPTKEQLISSVLQEISNHRLGLPANDVSSQMVIHSLVIVEEYKKKNPLKFYENSFEKQFLEETRTFYREKASELRYSRSCSDYMKEILHLLTEEEMRSRKFLHQSSCKKVTLACQQCVIFDHVKFLEDGCRSMIRTDARDDLLHMYMLLKSAPDGLSHMVTELEQHIRETGLDMVRGIRGANVSVQFVETVLDVHKRFSNLVSSLFHGDKHFVGALDNACTAIVNHHEPNQPCKAPEMVCKYCDAILRKCSKGSTEEADEKLQASITVFRYIDDKDIFQKFYSRSLAKRLISTNCAMEMEELMINRLKDVCGYEFTSKLHSMFTDVRLSAEHTKKFHESVPGFKGGLSMNMSVNILQAGAWPLNATQPAFLLPERLLKCMQTFEEFYHKQHNGRNLTWLHHLSQAEVKMQTETKPYFIIMSTYQLAVVLLFNEANSLTYQDITSLTHLQDKDLKRNVAALVDAKILIEHISNEDSGERSLEVNKTMVSKRTRFKVLVAPTQREQVQEVRQTHSSTDDDRKLYLQAAIVRIMKARKTLSHISLVEEVIAKSKMRFSPSVAAIKLSIESLIEKSYIERVPDTMDLYRYLA